MSKQETAHRHDVVILGGGPAGVSAALSLRRHAPALSVALVERSDYRTLRVGETLPPTAQMLLEQLGVWETFLADGHVAAYGTCAAWGSDRLYENEFIYHPSGRGWHLDRARFDRMLAREAAARGVALYSNRRCVNSRKSLDGSWQLTLRAEPASELLLNARFVVDATGRRAAFANRLGVRQVLIDRLLGLFVIFDGARLAETYTLVESWEEGWWYSALLPGGRVAVFCMTDADVLKKRRLNSAHEWLALLERTRHVKARVRGAEPLSSPSVHAAHTHRLERMAGEGWLAVGDAATTFDPLSSQGISKGLRSGMLAAYAVGEYFDGSAAGLEKYGALAAREFEEYLAVRADYYGRERRWPSSPFWQRRHAPVTLDPAQLLCSNAEGGGADFERLTMHLPAPDLRLLCQLCRAPRRACDVVSEFKARTSFAFDRRIILALQYLLEEGVIRPASHLT